MGELLVDETLVVPVKQVRYHSASSTVIGSTVIGSPLFLRPEFIQTTRSPKTS